MRLAAAACLVGVVGCGSRTYPVRGVVVFEDNKPAVELAGCFVTFQSEEQKTVSAQGMVRTDGTFTLTTFQKEDGAVPGPHKILLTPAPYMGSESGPSRPPPLPRHYSSFETSGLTETIEPKANEVTLRLQRSRP
jgi:hypothetical protein